MRNSLAVVALSTVASLSCAKAGTPIGSVAEDNVTLASSPLFAHYQGLISGASTVGDLLRNPLTFSGRPTPTALLQGIQASNPAMPAAGTALKILSLNVGLLDVQLYGLVQYARTPDLAVRAPIMAQTIFAQGYDVIALQELWRPQDVQRFRTAAASAGYWIVTSPRTGYTDGLAIAVKNTVAAAPGVIHSEPYSEISGNEFYPANGYSRGFLSVRFEHATLGPIVVYSTHVAAFPAAYPLRMSHVRELGLHMRKFVPADELVFAMGDFNAGPYYKTDVWSLPNNGAEPAWFANTLSYPMLMHYAGVTDLAVRGRSAMEATLDITLGDTVPNNPATSLATPFGDAAWCANTPAMFTATDCNSMYFTQYAATEFPARMDLVTARDPNNRIHVARARVAFADPVAYSDGRMGPLSDHYGQEVDVVIANR
jgi:endonuclease/exonuclease/phosphatase family metal-dependent hydrolase